MSSICNINKSLYAVINNSVDEIQLSTCLKVFSHNFECGGYEHISSSVLIMHAKRKMTKYTVNVCIRQDFQVVSPLCISLIKTTFSSSHHPHNGPCGSQCTHSHTVSHGYLYSDHRGDPANGFFPIDMGPEHEFHSISIHDCHGAASYFCLFRWLYWFQASFLRRLFLYYFIRLSSSIINSVSQFCRWGYNTIYKLYMQNPSVSL